MGGSFRRCAKLTGLSESVRKEDPPPTQAAREAGGSQGGGTYLRPKDSNAAVGVRDRATGKALEGADKQTDFPCSIVRLITGVEWDDQ